MKMHYGFPIIVGLVIFIGMLTAPFAIGTMTKEYKQPELKMPVGEKECIESKEFMRTEHMQLLNDWRDWALRDGKRIYTNHAGKEFVISLQNTCMKCTTTRPTSATSVILMPVSLPTAGIATFSRRVEIMKKDRRAFISLPVSPPPAGRGAQQPSPPAVLPRSRPTPTGCTPSSGPWSSIPPSCTPKRR